MYNFTSTLLVIIGAACILGGHFFLILPSLLLICIYLIAHIVWNGDLWLGLVLTIVYVGGILILFSYFVTLSPSTPIKVNWTLVLAPVVIIRIDKYTSINLIRSPTRILHLKYLTLFVFSVSWLLFAIIIVVYITGAFGGALRRWDGS